MWISEIHSSSPPRVANSHEFVIETTMDAFRDPRILRRGVHLSHSLEKNLVEELFWSKDLKYRVNTKYYTVIHKASCSTRFLSNHKI